MKRICLLSVIITIVSLFSIRVGRTSLVNLTGKTLFDGGDNITSDTATGLELLDVTATAGIATAGFVSLTDPRVSICRGRSFMPDSN